METKNAFQDGELNTPSLKKNAVISRLKDFCAYTTAHGLGRLVEARNIFWRIFWVIACICALTMFLLQVNALQDEYSRRPVKTRIDVQDEIELVFPEVTLCNLNILRKSHTHVHPELHKLMSGIYEVNGTDESQDEAEMEEELSLEVKLRKEIGKHLAYIADEELYHLGHQFDDMVVSCRFSGSKCRSNWSKKRLWRRYWDPKYGNCYQFNSGKTAKGQLIKPRSSTKAGPTFGLHFMLNVEQNEYFGELTTEAGIRVHIGSLGKMPFPYENGITVSPGFSTQISLTQTTVKRVDPFQNNSCLAAGTSVAENLYQLKYGVPEYSAISCKRSCYAHHQMSDCGCMESNFPIPNGTRVCDHRNQTEELCLELLFKKYKKGKLSCSEQCPPPCSEHTYQPTIATAWWPSSESEAKIQKELTKDKNHTVLNTDIRKNYLILKIYFKELNYILVEQSLAYGIESFLSDIGGNMGMWIGISALTCAELIELLLLAFHHFLKKITKSPGKVTTVENFNSEH